MGSTTSASSAVACEVSNVAKPGSEDATSLDEAGAACCWRWRSVFHAGWAISKRRCLSKAETFPAQLHVPMRSSLVDPPGPLPAQGHAGGVAKARAAGCTESATPVLEALANALATATAGATGQLLVHWSSVWALEPQKLTALMSQLVAAWRLPVLETAVADQFGKGWQSAADEADANEEPGEDVGGLIECCGWWPLESR